jgi:hypothetical protein
MEVQQKTYMLLLQETDNWENLERRQKKSTCTSATANLHLERRVKLSGSGSEGVYRQ